MLRNTWVAFGITAAMVGSAQAGVLIDFGIGTTSTATDGIGRSWNNITPTDQPLVGGVGPNAPRLLVADDNTPSGITLEMSNSTTTGANANSAFESGNPNGLSPSSGPALARNYPTSATTDSLYAYYVPGGGFNEPTGDVMLAMSGFDPGAAYNFHLFASRNSSSGNRETRYTFQGAGPAVSVDFNPVNNTTGVVLASGDIIASSTGTIDLTILATANNTNANKFIYLSVLEISEVPEPTSLALLGLGGLAIGRRRR